jgi:hypothetical protein
VTLNAGRAALLLSLVALAFGGWRLAAPAATDARDQSGEAVTGLAGAGDDARLGVAIANLELRHRSEGTYAGAAMPAGVVLVRATADGYCVQLGDGASSARVEHPGSGAAAGHC